MPDLIKRGDVVSLRQECIDSLTNHQHLKTELQGKSWIVDWIYTVNDVRYVYAKPLDGGMDYLETMLQKPVPDSFLVRNDFLTLVNNACQK